MRWVRVGALVFAAVLVLQPQATKGQTQTRAIYVADRGNHRIVRMNDMTGAGWTAFGSYAGRDTGCCIRVDQFWDPERIAVDAVGRLYVTDHGLRRVVRVDDMIGVGWTTFGWGPEMVFDDHGIILGFKTTAPDGIFVDAAGRIYLLVSTVFRSVTSFKISAVDFHITKIDDVTWAGSTPFGGAGTGKNQFWYPKGIFVDAAGQIYVADTGNQRLVRLGDMTGAGWTTLGHGPAIIVIAIGVSGAAGDFDEPSGVAVDTAGHIYVLDSGHHRVVRMDDMIGHGWISFGSQGSGANEFEHPQGLAIDTTGRIYIADTGNNRIVRVDDMTGAGWTTFGSQGGGANQFSDPFGIFVDSRSR